MQAAVKVALGVAAVVSLGACGRGSGSGDLWPRAAGANVLLVTVDTLRADRLTDARMPRLGALARRGHLFTTAYAHAPLTLPSHASILTGLLPPAHGVRGNGSFRLADAQVTLAERLKSAGYRTGAFVGAFVLDARFGLAQGFDVYQGVADDRAFAADFAFAERPAGAVLQQADAWLQQSSSAPWFAWIHLFDPHAPYEAAGATPAEAYDGEVRQVDAALGDFLDRLRARGALDRTLVVVTADHGEGLGAHDESTHGLFVYETTVRVPLVIAGPDGGTSTSPVPAAHIDLVPTVLDTLALPVDSTLPGRSLRADALDDRPIYAEALDGWLSAGAAPVRSVVEGGLKLISVPDAELYDLSSDPAEATNIYAASETRARALAAAVSRVETGLFSSGPSRDESADRRLRSLGYAAGAARSPSHAFAAADDPKRVRPLYERFLSILASGATDPDGLLRLVQERPAFEAARLAAASLLIEGGRGPEAVDLLDAASTTDASAALLERLGAALLAAGDPRRAVAVLAPLTAGTAPTASADAWNMLGVGRAQLGQRGEARRAMDRAVMMAPSAARFRLNRAFVRLEDGDRAGALDDASQIVAQSPELVDAWRLRATLHYEAGQAQAAIADWEKVVALEPTDADALFNIATAHDAAGNHDAAGQAARRYLALPARPGSGADRTAMQALASRR